MSKKQMGRRVDLITGNSRFIYGFIYFLLILGLLALYVTFFSSEKPKLPLLVAGVLFGLASFFFANRNKNEVILYDEGFIVEGMFTQNGEFMYQDVGRIDRYDDSWLNKLPGVSYCNIVVYDKNGKLLTGFSSFFYSDLGQKWEFVERRTSRVFRKTK